MTDDIAAAVDAPGTEDDNTPQPGEDDILQEAKDSFSRASDHENENRRTALEDIEFSRKGDQWPIEIVKQRNIEGRPCLTINKLPAFIRQVVNDARQNKPSIKVHPVDDEGDPETAAIYDGLIRNIEYTSHADVAYDTATEQAVGGGFGYIRVGLDYTHDDSFDLDISINRVANQFSVYGDPDSTAADSSDWNVAHILDRMSTDAFEAKYPDAEAVDWDGAEWMQVDSNWYSDDGVTVCEYWVRKEVERDICKLVDNRTGKTFVMAQEDLDADEDLQTMLSVGVIAYAKDKKGKPIKRKAKSWKVTQYILTACEVLKTTRWPGQYIPIIPVYGDEFFIEGKRYLRSLIHNAIDAQRMFNYWRTTSTELVALAPRVPYIGRKGAFDTDQSNWNTANTRSHPFLEYDGPDAPMRQPLDSGPAAGALSEAMNASDDMKAIIGLYDASLGARSNETSGVAINARNREGDVSTFHFVDNMARAIRWTGVILIDLIPKVYSEARIVRVIGEDGKQEAKPINQEYQKTDPKTQAPMMTPVGPMQPGQPPQPNQSADPQPVPPGAQTMQVPGQDGEPMQMIMGQDGQPIGVPLMAIHELGVGKYDLVVSTGPAYTTRRQEAAAEQMELIKAFPPAAPVIGPEIVRNMDWQGAEKIADQLEAMAPKPQQGLPPEIQQLIEAGKQQIQQLTQENQALKSSQAAAMAKTQQADLANQRTTATTAAADARKASYDRAQLEIEGYDAETRRLAAEASALSTLIPPAPSQRDLPQ